MSDPTHFMLHASATTVFPTHGFVLKCSKYPIIDLRGTPIVSMFKLGFLLFKRGLDAGALYHCVWCESAILYKFNQMNANMNAYVLKTLAVSREKFLDPLISLRVVWGLTGWYCVCLEPVCLPRQLALADSQGAAVAGGCKVQKRYACGCNMETS